MKKILIVLIALNSSAIANACPNLTGIYDNGSDKLNTFTIIQDKCEKITIIEAYDDDGDGTLDVFSRSYVIDGKVNHSELQKKYFTVIEDNQFTFVDSELVWIQSYGYKSSGFSSKYKRTFKLDSEKNLITSFCFSEDLNPELEEWEKSNSETLKRL